MYINRVFGTVKGVLTLIREVPLYLKVSQYIHECDLNLDRFYRVFAS